MPELPEVETVRRQLHQALAGRTVQTVRLFRSGREFPAGAAFENVLVGKKILSIDRRAKLLVWRFADGTALAAHLKMTGRFVFVDGKYVPAKHDHAQFVFDGKNLVWSDVRKFGFLKVLSADELATALDAYGPEPLETDEAILAELFRSPKTRAVKAALLDQATIAGVGNIYADESLHRAGLRPTRKLRTLTADDRLRLVREVKNVLQESVDQKGTSANDYVDTAGAKGGFLSLLRVYGRAGEPCRTCLTTIKRTVLGQRGTHFCPTCQR